MKFEFANGALTVRAETPQEGVEIIKHFRLDLVQYAANLQVMAHTSNPKKRPWFKRSLTLGPEWLKTYYTQLERITGFAGPLKAESPALRYPNSPGAWNLCHTHMVERAWIDEQGYHADGYVEAEDWNGMTAEQYATKLFHKYVATGIGYVKHEPEFIEMNNGFLKRNPNYLHRHLPAPGVNNGRVLEAMFEAWLEQHANDAQRELWAAGDDCYRGVCRDSLAAAISRQYQGFYVDNHTRHVTWQEFKALGVEENTHG